MKTTTKLQQSPRAAQNESFHKLAQIIEGYRGKDGSLIPVLHIAKGLYGDLTPALVSFISEKLEMSFDKVNGAATFYEHFAITQTCQFSRVPKEEIYQNIGEIIEDYRGKDGALIPVLHIAQGIYGHFTPELLEIIADKLDLPLAKVTGTATFYSYFSIAPKGKYTIRVCMGSSCYRQGSKQLLENIKTHLGIDVGETTPDGKYSLEVVRCIGECDKAPGISINSETSFTRVKPDNLDTILRTL